MNKNRYYHTCPRCGANLDPGERCDCEAAKFKTVLILDFFTGGRAYERID